MWVVPFEAFELSMSLISFYIVVGKCHLSFFRFNLYEFLIFLSMKQYKYYQSCNLDFQVIPLIYLNYAKGIIIALL